MGIEGQAPTGDVAPVEAAGILDAPIDAEEMEQQLVFVRRALEAEDEADKRAALAEGIWRFGPRFMSVLTFLSEEADERFTALFDDGIDVFARWLAGERLTDRVDEPERRAQTATMFLKAAGDESTPIVRLAALALLELPEGHEQRDVALATERLRDYLEHARATGDVDVQLMTIEDMVQYELEPRDRREQLIEDGLAVLPRAEGDGTRRTFYLAASGFYAGLAIEARDAGDSEGQERYGARAKEMIEQAAGDDPSQNSPALLNVLAVRLDVMGDEAEAADLYRQVIEHPDADSEARRMASLREGKLRQGFGDYARTVELFTPLVLELEERYLTALVPEDIADRGTELSDVVGGLAFAHASLGDWRRAVETIDRTKSVRLRFRASLRDTPAGRRLLELEQALYATSRGVTAELAIEVEEARDPLATAVSPGAQLLEAYRQARTDFPAELAAPSVKELAAALEPGEAAVVLGLHYTGTLIAVVTPGDEEPIGRSLVEEWTWNRWLTLLGPDETAWLFVLAAPEAELDAPAALADLLTAADEAIGRQIAALLRGASARRAVLIPHVFLHLLPYAALPSLASFDILIAPSAAQFVAARSSAPPPLGGGALVVSNPTLDLRLAPAESEAVVRHLASRGMSVDLLEGSAATEPAVEQALPSVSLLHFNGHGRSELLEPDRSALLLAPEVELVGGGDPFPDWRSRVSEWRERDEETRYGDLPGVGRLYETVPLESDRRECRLERGPRSTLFGLYRADELRILAELWSAGDLIVEERLPSCALAVLSACDSGAGTFSGDIDEHAGLPAALALTGVGTLVSTMWPVSEGLTALYCDLLYRELAASPTGLVDIVALVRQVSMRVRTLEAEAARTLLLELADATSDGYAAFSLEAFAESLGEGDTRPFDSPWEWGSFYVTGHGTVVLEEAA